jgi:class 3 adenylate cyclase
MECAACGHGNRESAAFCGACGQALLRDVTCPRCAASNPPGQRFCDACGQALSAAGSDEQAMTAAAPPPPPAAPPDAPASFAGGRYQVRGFLGEGAKKRVFLAHDGRLGRNVAIAWIKPEGLDAGGRERLQREAEAMGKLGDHPNAVTVYDVVEEAGQVCIVSQYMAGGDLEARLAAADERRLPVEEALRITDQVACALEHAHARGVIHRDVKPGNIWLGADGVARLGDFGLALALGQSRLTQHGMMVGTAAYMAPEQALGRQPDARSDLYALGATLYEMLAGRPPFVGDDPVAVISQHVNTPPVAPSWHNPRVAKPLEAVVLALLAKDPDARPRGAPELRAQLASLSRIRASGASEVAPAANPLDGLASGVFVGRDEEAARLRTGLDDAVAGRGRILLLVGEPGIGKTRTSEELVTYAHLRGAQVLWGRCYEGEGAPPYWPWVQIIRSYVHDCDPQTLASEMGAAATDIAEVVSEVRARLPGLPEAQRLEPEQARFRLFDGLVGFLRNASRRQPLVLVLDDLHWADKPSLLLLRFLAGELGSERLLVLGTYRDVELRRQHPLADTLAELARNPACERVLLRGLSQADVARFIERTSGREPPAELAEAVFRETEGNPFFVTEVVRLLAADGRLDQPPRDGSWSLEIPQGVREVVGRRLNHLSEECNQVLAVGSVIGRDFDVAVLGRVSELPEERLLDVLDEALSARVIGEVPETARRYRFSHALVRETLYGELNTPRRVRLHGRVGEALEALHGGAAGGHLAEISHHFFQAVQAGGGVDRAVAAATRAGDWAAERLAHAEAALHFERAVQALDLADQPDPARAALLSTRLAELWMEAGEAERGQGESLRAAERAREVGDAELLARSALAYGAGFPVIEMGRTDSTMVGLLEEALEAVGPEDSIFRTRLLDRLATELYFTAEPSRTQAIKDEAIAMARRLDDPRTLARALAWFTRIRMSWTPAEIEAQRAAQEEVVELASRAGDPNLAHIALVSLLQCALALGRREEVEQVQRRTEALIDQIRTPRVRYLALMYEALWAHLEGRFAAGLELSRRAFALGQRVYSDNALQWYACQLHSTLLHQGRARVGEPLTSWAERFPHYPVYASSLARNACAAGDLELGRRAYEGLAEKGFAFPEDGNYHNCCHLVAETCVELGDRERAPQLYEKLLPMAGVYAHWGPGIALLGPLERPLALLATLLGRHQAACGHFERTLASLEGLGAWPWLAQTQCDFARMLLARGGDGDSARAVALLNAALDRAQSLGMTPLVEQALASKLEAQGTSSGSFQQQRSIDVVATRVDRARPDLSRAAAPDGTVTLMFSDMEGFTAMTERLGDLKAREVIRQHNRIVREELALQGGYEVELQGDGFLLAFGSARRALHCAVGIQRAMGAWSEEHPEQPLRVRIGLHTGEALREADKFFGRTVILAARIAAQAQAGEILASAVLHELARSGGDFRFGAERVLDLKGIAQPQPVYAVEWRSS